MKAYLNAKARERSERARGSRAESSPARIPARGIMAPRAGMYISREKGRPRRADYVSIACSRRASPYIVCTIASCRYGYRRAPRDSFSPRAGLYLLPRRRVERPFKRNSRLQRRRQCKYEGARESLSASILLQDFFLFFL